MLLRIAQKASMMFHSIWVNWNEKIKFNFGIMEIQKEIANQVKFPSQTFILTIVYRREMVGKLRQRWKKRESDVKTTGHVTTSLHTKTNIAESTGSSAVENQNIEEILDFFDDDDVEFENKLAELSGDVSIIWYFCFILWGPE